MLAAGIDSHINTQSNAMTFLLEVQNVIALATYVTYSFKIRDEPLAVQTNK